VEVEEVEVIELALDHSVEERNQDDGVNELKTPDKRHFVLLRESLLCRQRVLQDEGLERTGRRVGSPQM
jgi:hypothetical protein